MVYSRNWWIRDSTIELRDRYWFRKRSLQIPEAWMEKWRAAFVKTGTLEIDDLADMAQLAGEGAKYSANIDRDKVLKCWSMSERRARQPEVPAVLRLARRRPAGERLLRVRPDGETLTEAQWQLAARTAGSWMPESKLVLTAVRKTGSWNPFEYSFTASTADGAKTKMILRSPRYEPPKKAEPGK